ncbi:MAG: malectin domain-containing carbohydrate-binding protein, partial [bacterium]
TSDFISDWYFTDTPGKTASVVDTSILTVNTAYAKNSAPQQTYQSTRYGDFTYEIPNLTANALYKIRLNFVESKFSGPGQRLFDVAINDTKVMESYDVFSAAGSKNIAMGKTFFFNADSSGKIKIDFVSVQSMAMVSGIELALASSGTSPVRAQGNQLLVDSTKDAKNTPAGTLMSPIIFRISDEDGNVTDSSTKVTLTTNGPGDFTTNSVTSVFAVNGVATFNNLRITKAGTYTITASALGNQPGLTSTFTISPLAADHLSILQGPTKLTAGEAITPSVSVGIVDIYDNPTGNASVTVTPTGPAGFATQSVATVQTTGGVATFDQLYLNKSGNYTLTFQSPGLTSITSAEFAVLQGAPARMNYLVQPVTTTAGDSIPNFSLEVVDNYDNRTNYTGTVTATASGPGSIASGTTTVSGVAGVATFTGLTINTAGTYTINAAGSGFATRSSNSFTVNPAAPSAMAMTSTIVSGRPGQVLSPITLELRDRFGNACTNSSAQVTITPVSGPGVFAPGSSTTVNLVGGVATFSNLVLNKAGRYAFNITTPGISTLTITNFDVIPFDYTVTTLTDAPVGSGSEI